MKFALIIVLFVTMLTPVKAQMQLDILYSTLPGARLHEVPGTGIEDSLSVSLFLHNLIRSLHDQSFMEASVDSVVYMKDKATAFIHAGPVYNHIRVSLDSIGENVLRSANIRAARYENRTLDMPAFRTLQNRLLGYYEDSGYPFAATAISPLEVRGDTIYGSLTVKKNHRYVIGSIYMNGDQPVKRDLLYRHIGIHPGDLYSESRFKRAGDLIREAEFLSEIRPPEMEFLPETADLYLYLERRQASRFSGILGIMPGDELNRTRLAGELNLDLLNVFSRMETISLLWQSPGNQVQQIALEMEQPWLFGQSFGAGLQLQMYRQDTTWLTIQAEGGIIFRIPGRGMLRVFGKTYGSTLIDDRGADNPLTGGSDAAGVTGRIFGVSYRHTSVSNRANPYRGLEINTSAGAGNKRISLPSDYQAAGKDRRSGFGEATASLRWFVPVTPSTTLMLAGLSGIRQNIGAGKGQDYFFANELYMLGGLHTIRGFDERSLSASSYAIQRIEYRYLFDDSGNIFLFFDGMAYRRKMHNRVISDTPFGFGGGLTFGTRAGQFSLSYALGRQHGNPLSLRSAKVHIGIINRF
jgi:outer membrane protein assembly factor BamA